GEGKHRLRLSFPDHADYLADVLISGKAPQDRADLKVALEKGTPQAWGGPTGTFKRPDYRTVGPVRLAVEPKDAVLEVNGKYFGPVSGWTNEDLKFSEMAVYEVKISAPNYETKVVRLLVSPASGEARATIREKLKPATR